MEHTFLSLQLLKCPILLNNINDLEKILKDNLDLNYIEIISFLSNKLQSLIKCEECVNKIEDHKHIKAFLIESSSLLREIRCPYKQLVEGEILDRLKSYEQRLACLAANINYHNKGFNASNQIPQTISESPIAMNLRMMFEALNIPKPPNNITASQLFGKLAPKIEEVKKTLVMEGRFEKPLLKVSEAKSLTTDDWAELATLADSFCQEYQMRKGLLLTRLDVTVASFTWSQRLKDKKGLIDQHYNPKRVMLDDRVNITLADILAAKDDLLYYDKTSDSNVRRYTRSKINKVLIGKVPDRGGRPSETEAPPPEVPSWKKDQNQHQGAGHQRGAGGRVQGNWSHSLNTRKVQSGGDFQRYGQQQNQQSAGNYKQPTILNDQQGFIANQGYNNYDNQHSGVSYPQHLSQQQFTYDPNPLMPHGQTFYNQAKRNRGGGLQQHHQRGRGGGYHNYEHY